jgi:hypothetical protein
MGLDMYLRANEYISRKDYKTVNGEMIAEINPIFDAIVKEFEMENAIDENGFAGISLDFPMGYWRKANQIHNWFVTFIGEGEDNCQTMYVPRDRLEELRDICLKVLEDNSLAKELLPTESGFFFGSTEYDEYYFGDLEETVKIINRCLASKFDSFEYQASW